MKQQFQSTNVTPTTFRQTHQRAPHYKLIRITTHQIMLLMKIIPIQTLYSIDSMTLKEVSLHLHVLVTRMI